MGQGCFGKCCGFGISACDSGKLVTVVAGESTDANLFLVKTGADGLSIAIQQSRTIRGREEEIE